MKRQNSYHPACLSVTYTACDGRIVSKSDGLETIRPSHIYHEAYDRPLLDK